MRALLILFLAVMRWSGGGPLAAQQAPPETHGTFVAATPGFDFHVDFWHNLHDYLYWRAQADGPSDEGQSCIASRPEAERVAWAETESFYAEELKDRHWRRDPVMRAVRYTLSGLAPHPDSLVTPVFQRLQVAASVYRTCFWERHRTLAGERVTDLVALLVVRGPALEERLSAYYDAPWPARIRVDIVPYGSYAGANTATGADTPSHMQISSTDPDLAGLSGLELLLHEASHEIFGPGRGLVGESIDRAAASLGVEPPRDLWHAISFFTTGYVMQEMAEESGIEYVPYGLRGLFSRAWPDYLEPIQRYWTPYLRGEVEAEKALRGVVSAIVK